MQVLGYLIGSSVQLDILHKQLINVGQKDKSQRYARVALRDTKLRLLMYLLENAEEKLITNQRIMINVWENYGLRSSSSRLWQVMQDLKSTLLSVGITFDDLIKKVDSRGYSVNEKMVITLYCKKSNVESVRQEQTRAY